MIELPPTANILDSSKIQTYMTCPRQYFFRYILGWESREPKPYLVFGSAWHAAMEAIYSGGFSDEACSQAFVAFQERLRQETTPEDDLLNAPLTLENGVRALSQYIEAYRPLDTFDVLHTEVAGSVLIGEGAPVYFRIDAICEGHEGVFVLEHKTTRWYYSAKWADQWRQKMQVSLYSHVLHCIFPHKRLYGAIINGAFITNPPRLKKDGTPYANARDNEFHRVPCRRSYEALNAWLWEVNDWAEAIQIDTAALMEPQDEAQPLRCFPRNTESCTHYARCPYLDYCAAWHSLDKMREVPPEYHVSHWDPREHTETASVSFTL